MKLLDERTKFGSHLDYTVIEFIHISAVTSGLIQNTL
jgi:hypothetical protein